MRLPAPALLSMVLVMVSAVDRYANAPAMQVAHRSHVINMLDGAALRAVIVAFRRSALNRVGYWSPDMITEDIDISWRLQLDHWDIRYEPNALCFILMPETLKGLWRQRLRWAQGGVDDRRQYPSVMGRVAGGKRQSGRPSGVTSSASSRPC